MPEASKKRPDYIGYVFLTKALLLKCLKENCQSEFNPQLSFKYSTSLYFITKIIFKSIINPNDTKKKAELS